MKKFIKIIDLVILSSVYYNIIIAAANSLPAPTTPANLQNQPLSAPVVQPQTISNLPVQQVPMPAIPAQGTTTYATGIQTQPQSVTPVAPAVQSVPTQAQIPVVTSNSGQINRQAVYNTRASANINRPPVYTQANMARVNRSPVIARPVEPVRPAPNRLGSQSFIKVGPEL